jgi:hypothetical protein
MYLDLASCYFLEGRGFDFRWRHWDFGPGADSASDGKEYQAYLLGVKGDQCVGLTKIPPSRAECLEILGASISLKVSACPGL